MSAEIFDGKVFADKILKDLAPRVTRLKKKSGRTPRLAILYFKGFAAAGIPRI